jgi:murein DD-endopeptidase MepM/ murein hydrolase activator NlpD
VTGLRRTAPKAIGVGLLVPSLVLAGTSGWGADGKGTHPTPKRSTSGKPNRVSAKPHTSPPPDPCTHVVRRGDSVSRLATRYCVTRQSIVTANHLAAVDAIRIGQPLQIPGCHTAVARPTAEPEASSPSGATNELVARVGPRKIPTRLFLAVPEFDRDAVVFQWPIDGPVASTFGRRHRGWHAGIDIQADMGTPIRAAAKGTVIVSGFERYYGNMVKVEHPGGFTSLYAHNLENLVEVGDVVETGAVIATVGRTGLASAHHLHFEIRHEGMAYNPVHLLEGRDTSVFAAAPSVPTASLSDEEDRE